MYLSPRTFLRNYKLLNIYKKYVQKKKSWLEFKKIKFELSKLKNEILIFVKMFEVLYIFLLGKKYYFIYKFKSYTVLRK